MSSTFENVSSKMTKENFNVSDDTKLASNRGQTVEGINGDDIRGEGWYRRRQKLDKKKLNRK